MEAEAARRRFIFEEMFLFQVAMAQRRMVFSQRTKKHSYSREATITDFFIKMLPYPLTASQIKVWEEISRDMDSPAPMNRLLQGDVGAGKTVISVLALLKAVESGIQAVMMAPTEILSEQHYLGLKRTVEAMGINVAMLTGSTGRKEKEVILQNAAAGELKILVGTHALIDEGVEFQRLGLAVVDEQHRFGVRQRAALQRKGNSPDTLVMTATPIPRTMALTLYGDLDISVIEELPPGRLPVKTYAVLPSALPKAYALVKEQLRQGRQGYVICPLVEESDKLDVKSAINLHETLSSKDFKDFKVGLLHGRMKPEEKEIVMASFRRGETAVLVSTTVIEVGVDIPNATVMIIQDADRFGLAQLHQLRGRVGRGRFQSYCILVAGPKTVEGKARLKAMVRTTDGFELAEEDLCLRGPGEFYGTRQSGLPEFKVADLLRDWKELQAARQEALDWVRKDPHFEKQESKALLDELKARFGSADGFIGAF